MHITIYKQLLLFLAATKKKIQIAILISQHIVKSNKHTKSFIIYIVYLVGYWTTKLTTTTTTKPDPNKHIETASRQQCCCIFFFFLFNENTLSFRSFSCCFFGFSFFSFYLFLFLSLFLPLLVFFLFNTFTDNDDDDDDDDLNNFFFPAISLVKYFFFCLS